MSVQRLPFRPFLTGLAIVTGLSACEPVPQQRGCQPLTGAGGQVIVACTPDGRPILVEPRPQNQASFPPASDPARRPAPAPTPPVQTGPIGATVASGAYGPVPTVIESTGEALPPPPATLEPVDPNAPRTPVTSFEPIAPAPVPVTGGAVSSDPNALPATVAPPPAAVVEQFTLGGAG